MMELDGLASPSEQGKKASHHLMNSYVAAGKLSSDKKISIEKRNKKITSPIPDANRNFAGAYKLSNYKHAVQNNMIKSVRNANATVSKSVRGNTKSRASTRNNSITWRNTATKFFEKKGQEINSYSLRNLLGKHETEILFSLLDENGKFGQILKQSEYESKVMCLILNLVGKALQAPVSKNVLNLVHKVMNNDLFLLHVQRYLLNFQKSIPNETEIQSLTNFTECIKKFQIYEPSNSEEVVLVLLPLLHCTCDIISSHGIELKVIKNNVCDIERKKDLFLEQYSKNEQDCIAKDKFRHQIQPPENYRSLSVLPTVDDIKNVTVFIRPNITEGSYLDVEHYLDIQFRLLKEDYIQPLRSGIRQYLLHFDGKRLSTQILRKLQDINVYYDFKLWYPHISENIMVYVASFDVTPFRHVNWECSKRFLSGSLICFSDDNFETIHLACIAQRDPEMLKTGQLMLKCDSDSIRSLRFDSSRNFVMVETQAYFESYRHNLCALREMNSDNLPMQKYIVHAEKNATCPSYLDISTVYNIEPLIFSKNAHKLIPVLQCNEWPNEIELSLDKSQFSALQAAITKEFSVIQGPPGTGKTFIGLKITQLLLHNKSICSLGSPLLVVCYTNHALDQFLAGILNYSEKLGRIGGRCKNEKLENYQLKNLRKKAREMGLQHIRKLMFSKYETLHYFSRVLEDVSKEISSSFSKILMDHKLFPVLNRNHYFSLTNGSEIDYNDGHTAEYWLGLYGYLSDAEIDDSQMEKETVTVSESEHKFCSSDVKISKAELLGFDEIDHIEEMRNIDDNIPLNLTKLHISEDSDGENQKDGEKWSYCTSKKKKKNVCQKLQSNIAMNVEEANAIVNVWKVPLEKRWSLYLYWQQCYLKYLNDKIQHFSKSVLRIQEELQELRDEEDICILRNCDVVGVTTTGAAKYRKIIQQLKPHIVIFEEAAEVLEAHVVTSLTKDTQHVILIGDHQQLRPIPTAYELAKKFNFDISLFERMVKNGMECHQLNIQHRMRPSIASLLTPHIYSVLYNHDSVLTFEAIKGVGKNMFFVNHNHLESQNSELKSHVNIHEAKFTVALSEYLIKQGYDSSQLTILTMYSGQLFVLKQLMKSQKILKEVRATVVDNYQGEENDIILISFVRSNESGAIGFLGTSNRVCVALSRARKGLYCIGNFDLLAESCELWKMITGKLASEKDIGPFLQLFCQIHPKTYVNVSSWEDFEKVPEGGCMMPCSQKLICGHVCTKKCHPVDQDHKLYKCMEKCDKILCKYNHICPKYCHEECKPCQVLISKIMPNCEHENRVWCHAENDHKICAAPCERKLGCGHNCPKICGVPCATECCFMITVTSPCGHKVEIQCHMQHDASLVQEACKEQCNTKLPCGHIFEEFCGLKLVNRIRKCKEICTRKLVCSHPCKNRCGDICKCNETVSKTYSCGHKDKVKCILFSSSTCKFPCHTVLPCHHMCSGNCTVCARGKHKPCKEMVTRVLNCQHSRLVHCSQENVECEKLCLKQLPCGHMCTNICSQPCTRYCQSMVRIQKPCGHVQVSKCYRREQTFCSKCIGGRVNILTEQSNDNLESCDDSSDEHAYFSDSSY